MKNHTITDILHSANTPRNSEGAFITLRDGRLLFAYTRYNDKGSRSGHDDDPADIVGRYSSDDGRTWGEDNLILASEGSENVMSVSLLRLRDGRIALFYLHKRGAIDCRPWVRFSSDEGASWSERVQMVDTLGYFGLNNDRVIELATGRLVVPMGFHNNIYYDDAAQTTELEPCGRFLVVISDDHGATWCRGPENWYLPSGRYYLQEPGVVELQDGRIWSFMRTNSTTQWQSFSCDGGETWTIPEPSRFYSASLSPLSMKRIPGNGALIAIWVDSAKAAELWGPEKDKVDLSAYGRDPSWGRTPLVYAISRDDGASWTPSRVIEAEPDHGYCYTAIHFSDEAMHLAYCCGGGHSSSVLQDLRIRRIPLDWL